jgi:hypothetical protein
LLLVILRWIVVVTMWLIVVIDENPFHPVVHPVEFVLSIVVCPCMSPKGPTNKANPWKLLKNAIAAIL